MASLALMLFFLLGAGGVWAARPLTSVYVLVVAYGVLAVRQISRRGNAADLAAWSTAMSVLLKLDESISKL